MQLLISMENYNKSLLFLGLIRNTKLFYKNLETAIILQRKKIIKNIYCIIWEKDAKSHKKELEFLTKNNINFLVEKDLDDNYLFEGSAGSGIKVIHSIKKGLELCDKNENILKTRYDVLFNEKILNSILSCDISFKNKDKFFNSKILVPGVHISKPYFFIDWFYYSHYSNLKKMIDIDLERLKNPSKLFRKLGINLEIGLGTWQFITPFAKINPLVDAYMMICPFFINQKRSPRFREHLIRSLRCKSFAYLIFAYFTNINRNVLIYPPKGIGFYSRRANFRQDNQFFYGKYKKNKPNILFYRANLFKFWPLPLKRTKDVFLYQNDLIKNFPYKNNFLIFNKIAKEYFLNNDLNYHLIADQFRVDQARIIESIYKIKKEEIFETFWR